MILRFIYGSVNNEYQYEDKKLKIIDEHLMRYFYTQMLL